MLFQKSVLFGLLTSAASALYSNQTAQIDAVAQTTTLAPSFSLQPIENTMTYADETTTFFITSTSYKTIWLTSASSTIAPVGATTTTSVGAAVAVAAEQKDAAASNVVEQTTTFTETETSTTITKTSTVFVTLGGNGASVTATIGSSSPIVTDDSFSPLKNNNKNANDLEALPSSSSSNISAAFNACVPITKYITVSASPEIRYVTVTAQPSSVNSNVPRFNSSNPTFKWSNTTTTI
ncbi:Srl1p NDAI_0E01110 [Naumovozyma dairenensis CBS 421]|uniref:Uncharacterized protein n=1 Tax=Naumovozyma dairenensis (strain ATCC 10597 / BCRC 20456 / CBS 421 / NBRC 0211 / NRRL Y-12639) TaxID=1071378 RepID=G0WB07_NAUDC|nr:hypothetical protein NDAI_0E01110 [Naumovozyma dairenensis CBS 421]CCD24927.1 hypothetical protein NDAI_0E01110 [Naumovozyma dairenensis CBS 421]